MKERFIAHWLDACHALGFSDNETRNMDIWGEMLAGMFLLAQENNGKETEEQFINRVCDCYFSLDIIKGVLDKLYKSYYMEKLGL